MLSIPSSFPFFSTLLFFLFLFYFLSHLSFLVHFLLTFFIALPFTVSQLHKTKHKYCIKWIYTCIFYISTCCNVKKTWFFVEDVLVKHCFQVFLYQHQDHITWSDYSFRKSNVGEKWVKLYKWLITPLSLLQKAGNSVNRNVPDNATLKWYSRKVWCKSLKWAYSLHPLLHNGGAVVMQLQRWLDWQGTTNGICCHAVCENINKQTKVSENKNIVLL